MLTVHFPGFVANPLQPTNEVVRWVSYSPAIARVEGCYLSKGNSGAVGIEYCDKAKVSPQPIV